MRKEILALLGVVRKQIGLRSDPASATGSLHAKVNNMGNVMNVALLRTVIASSNLVASAPTEHITFNTLSEGPVKVKEIMVHASGTVRVAFDLRGSSSQTENGYGYIAINGIQVSNAKKDDNTGAYVTFTEDIAVTKGDRVQLYIYESGSSYAYAKNFKIYADYAENVTYRVNID